jgi:large subunit ribosomal protein L25
MSNILIKLTKREAEGKKLAKLRESGFVPSVVYGGKGESFATQSESPATLKVVREAGKHTPIDIELDGKKHLAIIKSIDLDPVKHTLRHVAFHTINQNEKIVTEVPIHLEGIGQSAAERAGLVILQAIEHTEVRALPSNLPEALTVSVVGLETDEDKLTLADIKLPEGVEFADHEIDTTLVVANVYEPSSLQSANEASGGDATAEDATKVESEAGKPETSSEE